MARTKTFKFRCSELDLVMLTALAKQEGRTRADVIRRFIGSAFVVLPDEYNYMARMKVYADRYVGDVDTPYDPDEDELDDSYLELQKILQ